MPGMNRRVFIANAGAFGASLMLAGCVTEEEAGVQANAEPILAPAPSGMDRNYALMYGPIAGERFPIPAIDLNKVDPAFLRSEVDFATDEAPGTIVQEMQAGYMIKDRLLRPAMVGVARAG